MKIHFLFMKQKKEPQENLAMPKNSIVFILKFESEEERTKAINNERYSQIFGDLGQFAMSNNGTMTSKTSSKTSSKIKKE